MSAETRIRANRALNLAMQAHAARSYEHTMRAFFGPPFTAAELAEQQATMSAMYAALLAMVNPPKEDR